MDYGPVSLFDKIYPTNSFFSFNLNSNIFKHIKPNKHNEYRSSDTNLPKQESQQSNAYK